MTHRLFIGIEVPHLEITLLQSHLDRLRLPVVWEKPEKLHLTLNFLGRVPESQIPQLKSLISQTIKPFSPLTIHPQFLDTLYRRHDSSLVYLGLGGEVEILKNLQKSLSQSLAQISLPSQERFSPHITIGKLKKDDPQETKKFLAQVSDYDFTPLPPFTVDHLTLYESFLSRSGSTYQKKATFTLQSPQS